MQSSESTLQVQSSSKRLFWLIKGGKDMKEKFEKAEMEVIEFETEDVITASGGNELPGVDPFA